MAMILRHFAKPCKRIQRLNFLHPFVSWKRTAEFSMRWFLNFVNALQFCCVLLSRLKISENEMVTKFKELLFSARTMYGKSQVWQGPFGATASCMIFWGPSHTIVCWHRHGSKKWIRVRHALFRDGLEAKLWLVCDGRVCCVLVHVRTLTW